MSAKPDFLKKKFGPLQDKTLANALSHRLGTEFPRLGGPRMLALCAELVLEVVQAHLRPYEHLQHGQVLWMGYSIDDPPARRKRTADCDLVPLVLDLTAEDIQLRLDRQPKDKRLLHRILRLCHQAYDQGALLSNCDLAELLNTDDPIVAHLLTAHQRDTGRIVPRRATLHDVGSGLTHKRIILIKRYRDGKPADQIARETYHSLEAVDRYLGQYDRVRHCRQQGLTPQAIAYTLNCSLSLVNEYLNLDQELEAQHD
jgi:DNA-binding CsgD family transcriptional regulator